MSIPLPHPDGVFACGQFVVNAIGVGGSKVILPPSPTRVYVSVSNSSGGVVGFSSLVSAADSIGIFLPETGKVEWKWRDVGDLVTKSLFADVDFPDTPYFLETVDNLPSDSITEQVRENRQQSRTRNTQRVNRIRKRLEGIAAKIAARKQNARA